MPSAPSSSRRFQRSVVRLEAGDESGTAFLVQSSGRLGLFLTAYHVVAAAADANFPIRLRRSMGSASPATIVDTNPSRDLALLSAEIPLNANIRPAAVAIVRDVGRLTVLRMLDPKLRDCSAAPGIHSVRGRNRRKL